jgi:hypothetical protein
MNHVDHISNFESRTLPLIQSLNRTNFEFDLGLSSLRVLTAVQVTNHKLFSEKLNRNGYILRLHSKSELSDITDGESSIGGVPLNLSPGISCHA